MPTIDEVKAELVSYDPVMYADKEVLERSAKDLYFIDLRTALVNNNITVQSESREPGAEPAIQDPIKPRFIVRDEYILKSGRISQKALDDALRDYEAETGESLHPTPADKRSNVTLYNFLKQYIMFFREDGTEYEPPVRGSGIRKPVDKVEIIPSTEPAMHFNDVRNDPYFIIQ